MVITFENKYKNFLFKLKSDWSYQDVITIGTAGLAAASGINLIKKNVDHKKRLFL